jgi:hypothetical protein
MHNVSNSIKQIVDRDRARQRSSDAFIASFITPRERTRIEGALRNHFGAAHRLVR